MFKLFSRSLLMSMSVGALIAAVGCASDSSDGDDDDDDDDDDNTAGTGGTGGSGSGGSAGSTAPGTGNTVIKPSADGWVDRMDVGNDVSVQGSWYPYGDQYGDGPGDAKCLRVGMHTAAECSFITTPPPPPAMGFVNTDGIMCTSGEVAVIPPCQPGVTTSGCDGSPSKDYSNVWGAGIGFDFNADKGEEGGAKHTWDPAAVGVIGISFEIDTVPLAGLRVEFPLLLSDTEATTANLPVGSSTDDHPDGAPYWGATSTFPNSMVVAGAVNKVMFATDVKPPRTNYVYAPNKMLGIQFHVPAANTARSPYSFCVKNLTFLRQ